MNGHSGNGVRFDQKSIEIAEGVQPTAIKPSFFQKVRAIDLWGYKTLVVGVFLLAFLLCIVYHSQEQTALAVGLGLGDRRLRLRRRYSKRDDIQPPKTVKIQHPIQFRWILRRLKIQPPPLPNTAP